MKPDVTGVPGQAVAGISGPAEAALLARRWVRRAHEIVDEGEVEVHEILSANRRVLRRVAEALEEHGHLDADTIAVLAKEGRLIEQDDTRRRT